MDKRNYNNILAFLEEVTLFSLHLSGIKLQEHVVEKVLDNSDTLHRIDRIEKTWDRINLNLDYNFNATVRDNLLEEIDVSLNDVAKDYIEIKKHDYENKDVILMTLSESTNKLITLKNRLQMMIVE
jgi:hypothetical protein